MIQGLRIALRASPSASTAALVSFAGTAVVAFAAATGAWGATAPATQPRRATATPLAPAHDAFLSGDAFARAALFEFVAGRPDRAAELAGEALASGGTAGAPGGTVGAAGAPGGRGAVPAPALRFLRAEALRVAGEPDRASAEQEILLRSATGSPWARAALDLCTLDGAPCANQASFDAASAVTRGPLGLVAAVAYGERLARGSAANAERWGRPIEATEAAPFWLLILSRAHLAARDTASAQKALERAVDRAAKMVSSDLVSEAALRRAALAYHQRRYDEALRWIGRVTDEKGRPLSCPAAIVTGYAHYGLGQYREAALAFNFAQACARDRGERGRLLALEARCRALSGEQRLAAAVAGDAAQDLEAAARGEGVGIARLEDATDVLEWPLDLDVDRTRLARDFFRTQAAREGFFKGGGDSVSFSGFPFRVVREDATVLAPDGSSAPPRDTGDEDPARRRTAFAAQRAAERGNERARFAGLLRAEARALADTLSWTRLAPAESTAAVRDSRQAFNALGNSAARLEESLASAFALRARSLADRAKASARLAAPPPERREERYEGMNRTALEREAELLAAWGDSAEARAAREMPRWRDELPQQLAREAAAGLARRQIRSAALLARAQAVLDRAAHDPALARRQAELADARAIAAGALAADSTARRMRQAEALTRTTRHTEKLRERARVDYEVALYERSAWASLALDESDSTAADVAPAIQATEEFLARFPASPFATAARFNRADLEVRRALALARETRRAPDYRDAVARYEALLAGEPGFRRTDAILFNLAALARESGDEATADRRLAELLSRAPDSELAPEAHLTLGDRAFDAGRHDEAEAHYRAVASAGGHLAAMARYKQGYAAFRRQDAQAATIAFAELLALPDLAPAITTDALTQLARSLRLAGGAPAAERFLDAHLDVPYGRDLIGTIATQEKDDGAWDRAARAYRLLLARFPGRAENLGYAQEVLGAWDVRAREDERIATRLDLGHLFADPKNAPGSDPAQVAQARAFGARCLLEAGVLAQTRGESKKDRVALERAVLAYRELARAYPRSDSLAFAAFYEGQALFDLGRFPEAARAHERAAGASGAAAATAAPDSILRDAAFGAALARERIAGGGHYRSAADRDSLERAVERFERARPGDPRTPPLWLSLALGSKAEGDSTRARRVFERVAGRDTSEASRRAQSELGRVALAERRWLDAERLYAASAAAYLAAGDRAEETRLTELAASARFKEAEELEATRDTLRAAEDFRVLADRYPGFPRADVALYRAGLADLAAGRAQRAEEHLATLLERYPRSKLYDDALLKRGEAQLAARDTIAAAATYASARLSGPGANAVLAGPALEEAARLYRVSGDYTDAQATYERIAREVPDGRARSRALAGLVTLHYELGRRGEAWQALAPWRAARLPEGFAVDPDAEMEARFVWGRLLADSCVALPLAHPIKPALDRKLAVLGPALENLKAAARTVESPYWAESGFYAGLLLDDLGARLAILPPPGAMTSADSTGFRSAIGRQAATFYARAEDLWIATLEGLTDSAGVARSDTAAHRPMTGWPGRIWEKLEPRLTTHYPWRLSAVDLPPGDAGDPNAPGGFGDASDPGSIPGTNGSGGALVADLEGAVSSPPPGLDAGALEDLRNRVRWISQYVADDQIDAAAAWCEAGLKSFPVRAEIWNDLGAVRMRQGRWSVASRAWQEALRYDPKSPGALYNLAVFERFYRLDRAAARRHFERFLTLGVEFDETLADRMAEDRK